METIDQFELEKNKRIEMLNRLQDFILKGEKFGLQDENALIPKISSAINETKMERLKVALVGGFSEGKTSIVAAWSEHYDPETMIISQSESSDRVSIYNLEDFDLVDTPGLFGFKETDNQIKYKEITEKYISEANLVLYVTGPNNPIKDSHKEELKWLFKDLNLLSRTVFVISRFDEEVDIEDDMEFEERFKIKKENVLTRLRDFDILDSNQEIPIVAVAANPYGEGLDYWFENLEEYNRISRIKELQQVTALKIKEAGGVNEILMATTESVIKDTIKRQMPMVQQNMKIIDDDFKNITKSAESTNAKKVELEKTVGDTKLYLQEFVMHHFTEIIRKFQGSSMETIVDYFEEFIGREGINLSNRLEIEFERQIGFIKAYIYNSKIHFEANVTHFNGMLNDSTKKFVKLGSNSIGNIRVSSEDLKALRDFTMPDFKFKPWEAIKRAEQISSAFEMLGSGVDLLVEVADIYQQQKAQKEFEQAKNEILQNLNLQRQEYLNLLGDTGEFAREFFPEYQVLIDAIEEVNLQLVEIQHLKSKFEEWCNEGSLIEEEFQQMIKKAKEKHLMK